MKWAQDMILTSMREIFSCFEGGSSEVKREWRALVAQTDSDIEVGNWKHQLQLFYTLCARQLLFKY